MLPILDIFMINIKVSYKLIYPAPESLTVIRHCSCYADPVAYLSSSYFLMFLQKLNHICHLTIFSQFHFFIILDIMFLSAILPFKNS